MKIKELEPKLKNFYAPAFKARVAGQDLIEDHLLEVASVQVDSTLAGADQFTVVVNGPTPLEIERLFGIFGFGEPVEIDIGYQDSSAMKRLMEGIVTSVSTSFPAQGLPQVTVSGFDYSYCMLKGTHTQSWGTQKKDSFVVGQVASLNGLTAQTEDTLVEHPQVDQSQESDWAFVRRLADRNGFEAYVRGDVLHFKSPNNDQTKAIELDWGFGLKTFSPEVKLSEAVTEVEVVGWDVATKKEIVGTARAKDEPGRDGSSSSAAEILDRICRRGSRKDARKLRVRRPVYSQAEADRLAKAILKRRAEDFVTGGGETLGIPDLLPDTNISLGGIGTFSKTYYVHQTTHTVDTSGYRTSFQVRETTIREGGR